MRDGNALTRTPIPAAGTPLCLRSRIGLYVFCFVLLTTATAIIPVIASGRMTAERSPGVAIVPALRAPGEDDRPETMVFSAILVVRGDELESDGQVVVRTTGGLEVGRATVERSRAVVVIRPDDFSTTQFTEGARVGDSLSITYRPPETNRFISLETRSIRDELTRKQLDDYLTFRFDAVYRVDVSIRVETIEAIPLDFAGLAKSTYVLPEPAGSATIQEDGKGISLNGDARLKLDYAYDVTAETVLEFEFRTDGQSLMDGIGLEEDDNPFNARRIFSIAGNLHSRRFLVLPFADTPPANEWVTYAIPIGQYYTGTMTGVVLVREQADSLAEASSTYRNVVIRTGGEPSLRAGSPAARQQVQALDTTLSLQQEEPVLELNVDAYPNPFHQAGTIRVQLPEESRIRLDVYDVLGRRVAVVIDGVLPAGRHLLALDGTNWPDGLYLYRASVGGKVLTGTMTLVR